MRVDHLILTRYNVGLYQQERRTAHGDMITPNEWMSHRLSLFRRWCYPSVVHQTVRDWRWLIAIDPATPQDDHERLLAVLEDPRVHVVRWDRDGRATPTWPEIVEPFRTATTAEYLLTTRLDNDDALHANALAAIRQRVHPAINRSFIDLTTGIWANEDATHLIQVDFCDRYPNGATAFASLAERWGESPLRTAYCGVSHVHVGKLAPVIRVAGGEPMWLVITHDKNQSNKLDKPGRVLANLPVGFHVG